MLIMDPSIITGTINKLTSKCNGVYIVVKKVSKRLVGGVPAVLTWGA